MGERVDLQFQTGRLILVFGDVRLAAGVGQHQLLFPFTHTASWLEPESSFGASVLLSARVYAANTGMKWIGESPGRVFSSRAYEVSDDLVVSLSDSQLLALDAERRDDRLRLIIDLAGTLMQVDPGVYPSTDVQLSLSIPQELWLKNLDQIGSEVGILIRVPSPLTDGGALEPSAGTRDEASRSKVVARIRQARAEIRNGQYENSVATCRLALDGLCLLTPPPDARAVFAQKPSARTQAERWAAIHHDMQSLLSGAHHDDSLTRGFTWSRSDAEAVLAMVSCLVTRSFPVA